MCIIKSFAVLILSSTGCPLLAEPVECIQYRDQETRISHYWPITENKGVIAEVDPMLINKSQPDDSTFYQGYVIHYEKQGDKLTLNITSNVFEGFIEFAVGKYSPVMTADQQQIDIPRTSTEWVQIKLKGRNPLLVRCATIENPEQRAPEKLP